jgi:hypothetical protein
MKRSTARWTTAMAAAALIGLPAAGFAQTTPQTPPSQTSPAPTTSTQGQTSSSATSAADHVREAKQALAGVPASSIPAASRSKLSQLKTHLNNLDRLVANGGQTATSGSSAATSGASAKKGGAANWGTEAAAVDKLVSELTAESTDDTAKQKLMDVRRHITELAGSMSGSGTSQDQASAASATPSSDTMGANPSASQQSTPSSAAANPTPTSTDPTAAGAAQSSSSSTSPQSTSPTPSSPTQTNPSEPGAAPQTGTQGQVDTQAAKQHLSEARESLAQLTSLPEAGKLQGDARTQVSQLISNFNELITTQSDWKAAYAKVSANLDTLIGPDASSAPTATGTSGTAAAPSATAGTSGTAGASAPAMQIDPAIKTKLQEFRTHLKEFEQAAGGVNVAGASTSGSMAPAANPSSTMNPSNPAGASATSPSPTGAAPTTAAPEPTNTPMPTGTSGTTGAVGTSGTAAPTPTDVQPTTTGAASSGHSAEADKHLDAIQDILNKSKDGKLDKNQTDQIKMHLEELRQLIGQSK